MNTADTQNHKPLPAHVIISCYLLMVVAAIYGSSARIGGGDTWIALACGRYYTAGTWAASDQNRTVQMKILDHLGIHLTRQDPFSPFSRPCNPDNKGDVGWINQNWLSHVIFYKLFSTAGPMALVYFKCIQSLLTVLLIYWASRALYVHPLVTAAASSMGILMARSYIDLRPNVSSILFAAALLLILNLWKKGRAQAMLWLFPLMILWSTIHGGIIYAIVLVAILFLGQGSMVILTRFFG
ncbi:MAG: hypothetical protein V1793_00105, partial [Pseudomonadota bacterium]